MCVLYVLFFKVVIQLRIDKFYLVLEFSQILYRNHKKLFYIFKNYMKSNRQNV